MRRDEIHYRLKVGAETLERIESDLGVILDSLRDGGDIQALDRTMELVAKARHGLKLLAQASQPEMSYETQRPKVVHMLERSLVRQTGDTPA